VHLDVVVDDEDDVVDDMRPTPTLRQMSPTPKLPRTMFFLGREVNATYAAADDDDE
jgi:hypothetical protein